MKIKLSERTVEMSDICFATLRDRRGSQFRIDDKFVRSVNRGRGRSRVYDVSFDEAKAVLVYLEERMESMSSASREYGIIKATAKRLWNHLMEVRADGA